MVRKLSLDLFAELLGLLPIGSILRMAKRSCTDGSRSTSTISLCSMSMMGLRGLGRSEHSDPGRDGEGR